MKGEMFCGSDFQNVTCSGLNSEVQKRLYFVMFSLNLSSEYKSRQTVVGVLIVEKCVNDILYITPKQHLSSLK